MGGGALTHPISCLGLILQLSSPVLRDVLAMMVCNLSRTGHVFCLLLGLSSDCVQPIACQVTEVTWSAIGQAQPGLTRSKRQKWAHVVQLGVFVVSWHLECKEDTGTILLVADCVPVSCPKALHQWDWWYKIPKHHPGNKIGCSLEISVLYRPLHRLYLEWIARILKYILLVLILNCSI